MSTINIFMQHFFFFSALFNWKLSTQKGFYSIQHFLSITLFREVHDSTERTTARCKKGQGMWKQIAAKMFSMMEKSSGNFHWLEFPHFHSGWIYAEGRLEGNFSISIFITFYSWREIYYEYCIMIEAWVE